MLHSSRISPHRIFTSNISCSTYNFNCSGAALRALSYINPIVWIFEEAMTTRSYVEDEDGNQEEITIPIPSLLSIVFSSTSLDVLKFYNEKIFSQRLTLIGKFEESEDKCMGFEIVDHSIVPRLKGASSETIGDHVTNRDEDMDISDTNNDARDQEEANISNTVNYYLYQANNITPLELKALEQIHQETHLSASLHMRSYGMALLTVSNYRPTKQDLERVFFSNVNSENGFEENENLNLSPPFSQEIEELPKKELFFFLEDDHEEKNILCGITEDLSGVDDCQMRKNFDGNRQKFTTDGSDDKALEVQCREGKGTMIHDIPLGIRLVNSYRQGHNDRVMRIPEKLKITSPMSAWKSIPALSLNGEESRSPVMEVYLPKHSVSAVVIHRGTETLYGVAYTSLIVGVKERNVVMSGVTILPPGFLWISLALSLLGCNVDDILSHEKDTAHITECDITNCLIVKEYIYTLCVIAPDEYLINAVNYLFKSWIEA